MCGRTACTLAPDELVKACKYRGKNGKIQSPQWHQGSSRQYYPSYNVAPQAHTPVLISTKHVPVTNGNEEMPERTLQPMKWGLIPSWFKGDPAKFEYKMNNARSDGLLDKASYKTPLVQGKRCVVLADGFYEWKTEKGKKQPYYIYFKDMNTQKNKNSDEASDSSETKQLLTMAGLFDCWKCKNASGGEDDVLYSYAVITVDASESMKWLHHRMPAVLANEEAIRMWLDYGDFSYTKALQLLRPVNCLDWHPVSPAMNNSRYKEPDCITPIDLTKPADSKVAVKGAITSFFTKSPKKGASPSQLSSPSKQLGSKSSQVKPTTLSSWLVKSPRKQPKEEPQSPATKKQKFQ